MYLRDHACRKLYCPRNTVHLNLFLSFILRCVMALLRDLLMADSAGLPDDTVDYTDGFYFASNASVRNSCYCFVLFNYCC